MFRKTLRKITTTLAVVLTAAAIPLFLPLLFVPSSDGITNHAPIIAVPLITLLSLTMAFFSTPIICMPTFGAIGYFAIKKWSERQEHKQSTSLKAHMPIDTKSALKLAISYLFTGAVAELVVTIVVALIATTSNANSIGITLAMPSIAALVSIIIINFSIAKYQNRRQNRVPLTKILLVSAIITSLIPTTIILTIFGGLSAKYYNLAQPFITMSTLVGAVIFLTMTFIWYSYTNFIGHITKSYSLAELYRRTRQNSRNIILLSIAYCAVCVYSATNIFDHFDWSQLNAYLPLIHNLIVSCPGLLVVLINLPILCALLYFWRRKLRQASTTNAAITPYNLLASTMSALSLILLFIPLVSASAIVPILISRAASREALNKGSTDIITNTTHSLSKLSLLLYAVELAITVLYFRTVV